MLPLLTLVFLGTTITLTQSRYHGSEIGKHFCIIAPKGENVTGIWISLKNNCISSIRLKFGKDWSSEYGHHGKNEVEVQLNPGEKVFAASGTNNAYIHQLILFTGLPRELLLGPYVGKFQFTEYPTDPTHELRGICGFYTLGGMRGIEFLWGSVNSTCAQ